MGAGMLSLVAPTAAKVFAMNPLLAGAAPGKGYLFPELSSAQRFTMSWGVVAERVVTLIRSTPSRHTPVLSTTMLVSAVFAADAVRHDSEPYLQRPSLYLAHNVFRLCPTNSFVGY